MTEPADPSALAANRPQSTQPSPDPPTAREARTYIATFRQHTMPGTRYVETDTRRIELDHMTDADAVFVAREFMRMETEAARRSAGRRRPS